MDHNYELLFRRTLKEKKNIQSNNIKGRNLHASLPRPIEGLVSDEDISIFLKYKEKFQNLHPFQKEIIIKIYLKSPMAVKIQRFQKILLLLISSFTKRI